MMPLTDHHRSIFDKCPHLHVRSVQQFDGPDDRGNNYSFALAPLVKADSHTLPADHLHFRDALYKNIRHAMRIDCLDLECIHSHDVNPPVLFGLRHNATINTPELHQENGSMLWKLIGIFFESYGTSVTPASTQNFRSRSAKAKEILTNNATADGASQRKSTTGNSSPLNTATTKRPSSARSAVDDLKSIILRAPSQPIQRAMPGRLRSFVVAPAPYLNRHLSATNTATATTRNTTTVTTSVIAPSTFPMRKVAVLH